MKISMMGAGLIGKERIQALQWINSNTTLNIDFKVFDPNAEALEKAKKQYNIDTCSFEEAFTWQPNWVFIATPNHVVKDIATKAFASGANVLLEKPFGRTLKECEDIIALKPEDKKLYVGFNYRFFDGVERALQDAKDGKFGKLISVNMILGHGNAPGMEKSWKLNPILGGVDVLTDLGVHTLDLASQLAEGELKVDYAKSWRGFWNVGLDEETHMMLSDANNTIFNIQVSLNRWRSNFRLEIHGTEGYGVVYGRGRSYGPQYYYTGNKWAWESTNKSQAETETIVIDNYDCKNSFIKETLYALDHNSLIKPCTYDQGRKVMLLLDECNKKIGI